MTERATYRSRRTRIIGERFYIYAARKPSDPKGFDELGCVPGDPGVPTGLIVGSAVIDHCAANNGHYEWHLTDVKRYKRPRKPKRMPQPMWFMPF